MRGGVAVDDFLEREVGGVYHRAIILADLGGAVESARVEWELDDGEEATTLVRLCRELEDCLARLSLLPTGVLTLFRECRRCGGAGEVAGENPCVECGGSGSIHADEASG